MICIPELLFWIGIAVISVALLFLGEKAFVHSDQPDQEPK